MVEATRNVASELHMLLLIIANRNFVRIVEKNITRHQYRVVEQTCPDRLLLLRLVLVLRHLLQPTERGHTVQQPARLGVSADVTLDEEG